MKTYLTYFLIMVCTSILSQTLEKSYSTDYYGKGLNYSFIINNKLNFYTLDRNTKEISFYDSSHNLTKTTTINIESGWDIRYIYLISDKLFNTDSKIEFLVESRKPNDAYTNLTVFNEDGLEGITFETVDDFKLIKTPENTYKLITFSQIPVNNGKYEYKVYALDGTLDVIQENLLSKSVIQYPNPTSKKLYLKNIEINNKSMIQVFTIDGKTVLKKTMKLNQNFIDVSSLSNGVYYYKIGNYTNRFIKE